MDLQQQIEQALGALQREDYKRAHELAMSALREDPQLAGGYFVMAMIAQRHGNVTKAEEVIRRAIHFEPENADYLLLQARCLLELSRHDEVRRLVAKLANRELATAYQNDSLGVIHTRLGEHRLALDRFKAACAKAPGSVDYQFNLGSCQQFCGELAAARSTFETIIGIDSKHCASHLALAQLRKHTAEDNDLCPLKNLWAELDDSDADSHLYIGHALAKVCEDLGDYAGAMRYLRAAKQTKLEHYAAKMPDYDGVFAALMDMPIAASEAGVADSDEPIFVVGMPRTGTTLIERILSSHSCVESAGELANLSLLVKQQLGTASPWVLDQDTLSRMHRLDFKRLGEDYLASTRHLTGSRPHFVDKMPFNFMYIPVITAALPGAKIICLRRNPMDTCLSNYRQLFGVDFSYYSYALSLRRTAQFYVHFHRLMAHFEKTLPGRFLQLEYEGLVREPERQTRRLLEYCGLAWEPQCLDFQHNAAPVATASSLQVRQGFNTQGLERWRRYESWLGELRDELDKEKIAWDS